MIGQGYLGAAQESAEQTAAAQPAKTIEQLLREQGAAIAAMQRKAEEQLLFRKIATGAAVAGALFALIRLSDIYFAVKARKGAA